MMFLRIPANLANWPTPARLAAAHRIPTDFGLGNTATRLKNVVELARELGGMAPESLWLNYRFPYTTPKTITITLSANGIGDAVCALYAAAGLARVTDRPIELVTRHRAWLEGFHVPGVEIVAQSDGQHINANWDYDRQVKSATSRKQDYCNALADALFLPPFPPQKPTRRTSVTPRARRIILAPFSEGPDRIWPYWKELARVLIDAGEEVVGVGAAKDAWAMAGICSGVAGAEPAEVMALLDSAACVVSNDSAMAHLGGLLGVPTICVHAGCLPHGFLFDLTDVLSVTADGAVRCGKDSRADLLAKVGVEEVTGTVFNLIRASTTSELLQLTTR